MRPIKFRAWQKKWKKMMTVDELNHIHTWQPEGLMGVNGIDCTIGIMGGVHDDCELMQFTGLFDKNGKEIYEGDILEDILRYRFTVYFGEFEADWHSGTDDGSNKVIGFYNVGREFGLSHSTNNLVEDARDRIVIGNIYENPDLITK